MPREFSSKERERIRYWVRQGQVIEVGFQLLINSSKNHETYKLLSKELIFAAGASYAFDLITFMLDEGTTETETDMQLITKLHSELTLWDQKLRALIASAVPDQGKPS